MLLAWLPVLLALPTARGANPAPIQFNRDVRPILSDTCFHCHGFDGSKRKADLRLDTRDGALASRTNGRPAIVPGKLDASEMWRRVSSTDPGVIMPPPDAHKTLTAAQIDVLKRWIQEGAPYQKHWAFETPRKPQLPAVATTARVANPIDQFLLASLEAKKLTYTTEAPRESLLRRVSLDLTGLPPTIEEVEAFISDQSTNAYEKAVDRLLASSNYGEHMARYWLDVARYGDTHGLHLDNERSMWPYRDWVVQAFNANLPFDQFTTWQLAGDLLENPTREQLIASGFNRCNVSTSEGGAIDEEFQVRYAVDRVETTSTAWMGLTMGCAACHDHKLDPITQKEFYQMFSIFNNMAEKAMDGNALLPPPTLPLPTPEQETKLNEFKVRAAELEKSKATRVKNLAYLDPALETNRPPPAPSTEIWLAEDFPAGAELGTIEGPSDTWVKAPDHPVKQGERALRRSGKGLHQVFFAKSDRTYLLGPQDKLVAWVYLKPDDLPRAIMIQLHTDSWSHRANWGDREVIPWPHKNIGALPKAGEWVQLQASAKQLGIMAPVQVTGLAVTMQDGTAYWDDVGFVSEKDPARDPALSLIAWTKSEAALGNRSKAPAPVKEALKKKETERTPEEQARLRQHFLSEVYAGDPELQKIRTGLGPINRERDEFEKQIPATMISKELETPRSAYVLLRGEYDKHGEPVGPGVPSVLPPLPPSDKTNRLALARWLVDPQHPLTARVTVNRFWQQVFGVGLVKTAEDFGSKGEWPSHPELLDWLAVDFIEHGWDVKRLMRLMVTSAAYRQDTKVTPEIAAMDPENRLLARGPKHRLDAEVLRDNALFVSGLLNPKRGGRGVRTYQPPGIWEAVGYTTSNTAKYSQDKGDDIYRRSLYLFWKRTAPPPMMTTFDSPSREQCRARRERTNTPLQALLTMNDIQYFEAARHLAARMWRADASDAQRLRYGFRLVTARWPSAQEQKVLEEALAAQRARYSADAESAKKVLTVGDSPAPSDIAAPELASYTLVANLLLNLDEALTKN